MDKIEEYYRSNQGKMDVLDPEPETWAGIEDRLDNPRRSPKVFVYLSIAAAAILLAVVFLVMDVEKGGETVDHSNALAVGDQFPELILDNQFGTEVPLSSLKGDVVLVEFWASYSKVCTDRQCYYFQPVYEEYAEKGFEIYGISLDTNSREWLSALDGQGLPWVNVAEFDNGADLRHKFLIQQLPTTFLLDQEGRIVATDVGEGELEVHLERLLAAD